jgi:hypothetical protein
VLLAGAVSLLVTGIVALVFYVSVVRRARGRSAYTVGLPPAMLARPLARRAAYEVALDGPDDRTTPAGTPSTAHRWRVVAPAAPDDPLCQGEADDALVARDESGSRRVALPIPLRMYVATEPRPVPPRVLATCAAARDALSREGSLEYVEEYVPRDAPAEIAACANPSVVDAPLGLCDDGAPSRIYPRERASVARARARGAMFRIAGCASAFALVCFAVGLVALRRFDQQRRGA